MIMIIVGDQQGPLGISTANTETAKEEEER
jgi:hypothetical protein